MSLYDELLAAGCDLDHHASDLYVRVTPDATRIIKAHLAAGTLQTRPQTFVSNVDGARWYDVPFMYAPYWRARGGQ